MIFWMDANRHNWSLVMVTYLYSDEILSGDRYNEHGGHYEDEYYYEDVGEDYEDDGEDDGEDYEEDYTYNNEDREAENNDTILTHTYPLWVGASQNTAYTCGEYCGYLTVCCVVGSYVFLWLNVLWKTTKVYHKNFS